MGFAQNPGRALTGLEAEDYKLRVQDPALNRERRKEGCKEAMDVMDLTLRLQRHSGLTQNECHLRDYILRCPEKVARMNTRELAQASFTSPAAVIRFCQKFGFKGLKDFKAELFRTEAPPRGDAPPDADFPFGADTPPAQVTEAVLQVEQEALDRVRQTLRTATAARAVDLLQKAAFIDVCAIGTSGYIGADFAFRLRKFGYRVSLMSDRVDLSYSIQQMDSSHCLLALSYSGSNEQLRYALRAARERDTPVVAVTARPESAAGMQADCLLPLPPMESNDAKISTFASSVEEKAVMDVLLARLFQKEYERNASFVRSDAERLVDVRLKK